MGVALLALAVALACLLSPERAGDLLPWALRPLHARCIGAMYLVTALCLLACAREPDAAVVRIPLTLVIGGAGAVALAAGTLRPVPWLFVLLHGAAAAGAWALAWRGRELLAPAEQPDAGLLGLAAVLTGGAAALAFAPQIIAPRWPWPMPEAVAPLYAAPLFAWGLACAQVARERRRAARRIVLLGLGGLGLLLIGVSALHWQVLRAGAAPAWFIGLGAGTTLAAHRLTRRTRPAIG